MLRASYLAAVPGESSTLTFTTFSRPAYSVESYSRTGATMRQGPHQGAHKSRITNWDASSAPAIVESSAGTNHGMSALHFAHLGLPLDATGVRFLVPQDGHTAIPESAMPSIMPEAPRPTSHVLTCCAEAAMPGDRSRR